MKRLMFPLIVLVALAFSAFGQAEVPAACGDPEVVRTKEMYRKASPQVKANTWLAHLLTIRADGKRTPEQIASIDEVIPLLTADVFDKGKKTIPDDVQARSIKAFEDERWLLSSIGNDAKLYLAKNIPLLTMQTVASFGNCNCLDTWGCSNGPYKGQQYCVLGQTSGCNGTVEGCGWFWLQHCNGLCMNLN